MAQARRAVARYRKATDAVPVVVTPGETLCPTDRSVNHPLCSAGNYAQLIQVKAAGTGKS